MHRTLKVFAVAMLSMAFVSAGPARAGCIPAVSASGEQEQPRAQEAVQTFNGTILSMNGALFILRDNERQTWFHLDDQQQAGKFLGKKVTVTGVLDAASDTIHVKSITEEKN